MKEDYNGFSYYEDKINKFCNYDEEEYKKISGSVKTKFSLDGLKKTNEIISKRLEADEEIERIIKVRDLESIDCVTASSSVGGTIGASMDYGIFKNLYFTNKRIIMADTNVANQYIFDKSTAFEEVVGIRFTCKDIKVIKDEDGNYSIKERMQLSKKIEIGFLIFCICMTLVKYYTGSKFDTYISLFGAGFAILTLIGTIINEHIIDKIKLATKSGKVYRMLIASQDYDEARKYIEDKFKSK